MTLSIRREDTPHGPEIVATTVGMLGAVELERWTVGEFETVLQCWINVTRSARAALSARHRLNNLPMRS